MGGVHEPLLRKILADRGLTDEVTIEKFLHPSYEEGIHDPFLMRDMGKAVARIFAAMENQERIAVYSDFDCDGIPGAAVLLQFFERIGYTQVESYIPHRHFEGYGLHKAALDKLKNSGVSLVITVDLGVTAVESVAHANELGIDVIVTDHHEPPHLSSSRALHASASPTQDDDRCGESQPEELPQAFAILNPKFAPYPDPNLCGAATAWKLVCALLIEGKKRELPAFTAIPDGWEKWLLDLVGIATVADMVPLLGENRVLAYFGLLVLRKTKRPGIAALMRLLHANQSTLTEDDIGFLIAPRINAASRMDNPGLALRLLATRDTREAEVLAHELEALNKKRKGAVAAMTREINKRLHEKEGGTGVTVLGDPQWKPALLGLAANGALDTQGGIVCVWGRDGTGVIKGSCRSDGSASVVALLRAAADSLLEFGGHHGAGGFSVSHEKVYSLQQCFDEALTTIAQNAPEPEATLYEADFVDMHLGLFRALAELAPFGMGNEKPTFILRGAVRNMRQFGKAQEHLEIQVGNDSKTLKAICFFAKPEQFTYAPTAQSPIELLGQLEYSVYGGKGELRMRIVDIRSPH